MTDETTLTVDRDVPFRETPERTLRMDVYRPSDDPGDAEPRPAVVCVHGGGWREGSKGQLSRYALELAAAGYVAVESTYRLSHEVTFPAALSDVKGAVRSVRQRAGEFGVDPDRIGSFGHSAGAHLAVLAAVTGNDPAIEPIEENDEPHVSSRLAAAVGVSGVYDLAAAWEAGDPVVGDFLGGSPEALPDRYAAASVRTHVDADGPPILLSHARGDDVVPVSQTEDCYDALVDAGVDVERHVVDGGDHVFLHSSAWYPETFPRYREFFDSRL